MNKYHKGLTRAMNQHGLPLAAEGLDALADMLLTKGHVPGVGNRVLLSFLDLAPSYIDLAKVRAVAARHFPAHVAEGICQ